MSNIDLIYLEHISLTPKQLIMRDGEPKTVEYGHRDVIVNLHPNRGTHCV